jgi:hypothetical protein
MEWKQPSHGGELWEDTHTPVASSFLCRAVAELKLVFASIFQLPQERVMGK